MATFINMAVYLKMYYKYKNILSSNKILFYNGLMYFVHISGSKLYEYFMQSYYNFTFFTQITALNDKTGNSIEIFTRHTHILYEGSQYYLTVNLLIILSSNNDGESIHCFHVPLVSPFTVSVYPPSSIVRSLLLVLLVFCVVILFCLYSFCVSYPMLPVSPNCLFLMASSVFSNVSIMRL